MWSILHWPNESGADMNSKIRAVLLAVMLPGLSFAQGSSNYLCTHGDLQRRVEILYETGMTFPCEVHYYKDTEAPGEPQVLWRAMQQAGYCEQKTEDFIAKLTGLGWSCGSNDAAIENPEPEPADEAEEPAEDDDTEALTPGDR
jgi:hypothetical protein